MTPPRWVALLDGLSPQLAMVLGDWLPQLQQVLSAPLSGRASDRRGEPDGVADLSRRGTAERLTMSEWALADVAPDLFVLRAANAEQLHTALAYRQPSDDRVIALIFDAGPDQAGAPRLVHMALAVLAAALPGRHVVWGVVDRPGELHPLNPTDPDSWRAILRARCSQRACAEAWTLWRDPVRDAQAVWVGEDPPRAPGLVVSVAESLAAAAVEVRAAGLRVMLPLPPFSEVALALRGQFVPQVVATGMGFGATKRTDCMLWTETVAYHVGGSGGVKWTARARPGWRVVAATLRRKERSILYARHTKVWTSGQGQPGSDPSKAATLQPPPATHGVQLRSPVREVHGFWMVSGGHVVHADGVLYFIQSNDHDAVVLADVEPGCVALLLGRGLYFVDSECPGEVHMIPEQGVPTTVATRCATVVSALVHVVGTHNLLGQTEGGWTVVVRGEQTEMPPSPDGAVALAAIRSGMHTHLVLFDAAQGTLSVGARILDTPPIVAAVAQARAARVLCRCDDGSVIRLDLQTVLANPTAGVPVITQYRPLS